LALDRAYPSISMLLLLMVNSGTLTSIRGRLSHARSLAEASGSSARLFEYSFAEICGPVEGPARVTSKLPNRNFGF
jgi:hypothetical protein